MPDWCNGLVAFSYPYQNSQCRKQLTNMSKTRSMAQFFPTKIDHNEWCISGFMTHADPEFMFLRMRFALSCGLSWAIWLMRCCIVFGNPHGNFLNCWPLLVPCWRFTSTTPGSWAFALARSWVYCVLIFQHRVGKSATVRCRNICDTLTQFIRFLQSVWLHWHPCGWFWPLVHWTGCTAWFPRSTTLAASDAVARPTVCSLPFWAAWRSVSWGSFADETPQRAAGEEGASDDVVCMWRFRRSMSLSGFMKRTCLTRRKQPEVVAERSDVGMTAIATLRVLQAPFRWSLNQTILKSGTWFHGTIIKHRCFAFLFLTETNSEAL